MPRFRETVPVDDYVFDVLMRDLLGHDRQPSAYLIYLYLYGMAARRRWQPIAISLRELSDATGVSKSAVQVALEHLRLRPTHHNLALARDRHAVSSHPAALATLGEQIVRLPCRRLERSNRRGRRERSPTSWKRMSTIFQRTLCSDRCCSRIRRPEGSRTGPSTCC